MKRVVKSSLNVFYTLKKKLWSNLFVGLSVCNLIWKSISSAFKIIISFGVYFIPSESIKVEWQAGKFDDNILRLLFLSFRWIKHNLRLRSAKWLVYLIELYLWRWLSVVRKIAVVYFSSVKPKYLLNYSCLVRLATTGVIA